MTRRTKTIEELNNDLNNLKCRYESEGLNIDRLLVNYHRYNTAKIYLSRDKDNPSNDPQIIEKRRIVSENHEAYKKYRSIRNKIFGHGLKSVNIWCKCTTVEAMQKKYDSYD